MRKRTTGQIAGDRIEGGNKKNKPQIRPTLGRIPHETAPPQHNKIVGLLVR